MIPLVGSFCNNSNPCLGSSELRLLQGTQIALTEARKPYDRPDPGYSVRIDTVAQGAGVNASRPMVITVDDDEPEQEPMNPGDQLTKEMTNIVECCSIGFGLGYLFSKIGNGRNF
ncbi:MAG TPA: hypothetical protein VGZ00_11590 [Candidatus Baltobacteraceae bacterium]|jgi:hypothetical protein|nr:hypothetical protein [Candidatus Baltobacteraceae bacterium]